MNKKIDVSNSILTSNRLILRPWKRSDLDDFFEYASMDIVAQMAGWDSHKTKEESKKILDIFITGTRSLAIEYKGKVIGSINIRPCNEEEIIEKCENKCGGEMSFVLSKDYWGQGIIPEAIKTLQDFLFNERKIDFITCKHLLTNTQSARVQEKCGFSLMKKIKIDNHFGEIVPANINIIWAKDYLKLKSRS